MKINEGRIENFATLAPLPSHFHVMACFLFQARQFLAGFISSMVFDNLLILSNVVILAHISAVTATDPSSIFKAPNLFWGIEISNILGSFVFLLIADSFIPPARS